MKQHFLGWFCRWLNNRGILTHPAPDGRDPCRTVTERVNTWPIVPRRLVVWRVARTLEILYGPERFARMTLVTVEQRERSGSRLIWRLTYTMGCVK